ncbi:helix-turn-helix domain-containing protein [Saccharothrix deserti]|uniref:helix-turn-helix domain-containing protein n=1 Tax=Saccharothrix deserti TaxID=2593674 RepID=UPI00192E6106|nr:helix-turn-helix domain-containing protein [Saccharothrix deserti]
MSTTLIPVGVRRLNLQLAFADAGTAISGRIRDRRPKACYRELSQAGLTETVTDVALRWGFNDVAHFSRTFKRHSTPRRTAS